MGWTDPRTWADGETVTAALMNAHLRDNLKTIGDAAGAYTSTLSNWTLGNGTIDATFAESGKDVRFRIKLTAGSTTTFAGSPNLTLPSPAVMTRGLVLSVLYFDTSATSYRFGWATNSAASTLLFRDDTSAALSATNPFTWATGDELVVAGRYERS